jgi:hypothetical protein
MNDMNVTHESLVADVPAGTGGFMEMFQTPAHLDQSIRQAVQLCWTVIPKDRRTIEELNQQFRRVAERALRDFAEDKTAFAPATSVDK